MLFVFCSIKAKSIWLIENRLNMKVLLHTLKSWRPELLITLSIEMELSLSRKRLTRAIASSLKAASCLRSLALKKISKKWLISCQIELKIFQAQGKWSSRIKKGKYKSPSLLMSPKKLFGQQLFSIWVLSQLLSLIFAYLAISQMIFNQEHPISPRIK